MEKVVFMGIFLVFVAFTARDILLRWHQMVDNEDNTDSYVNTDVKKEIPTMSFKSHQSGPTLKILYCYSCGYKRAFDEYSNMIRDRFPELSIIGDNFTPTFGRNKLVQLLTVVKLTVMALLIANVNPFNSMGVNTPQVWNWMTQHKMYACLMVFFLSNTIESQLMSTGAFEVFYNDVPVWSKLTTGRIPSPPEMFEIIENQHKLYAKQLDLDIHTLPGRHI